MSDLDLTAAIEAAMRGFCSDLVPPTDPESLSAIQRHVIRGQTLSYVTHAAPLIEAQVREQVAKEIDLPAVMNRLMYGSADDLMMADRINRAVGVSRVRRTAQGMSW